MCKLTENAFRDVNIAFANELSLICDRLKIDVWELIRLANRHPRVNVLQPGPGVGGHCIACDPWFIVASAPEEARLIRAAREINDGKPDWVIAKIFAALESLTPRPVATRPVVACYGVAFKPDIDDLRDSPSLAIARRVAASGQCELLIVEPHVDSLPGGLEDARLVSIEEARHADVHVLLVDHSCFKEIAPPQGVRIDTRGMGW
jgi:UDP-N-acetyl-D-mannosaminuronic acid dehydrogenase